MYWWYFAGHPKKQKSCEVTYTKTFDQARLARIGNNTFLAYLTTTTVEERCERGLPETTHVTCLINIVLIEPGCLLDAWNYQTEGIYQTNMNSTQSEENLPAPVILPEWEMAVDMNMSGIFLDYPHLQEIKIPSFHQIDDTLERDVINALKNSAYNGMKTGVFGLLVSVPWLPYWE